jgi:hypothetical protein
MVGVRVKKWGKVATLISLALFFSACSSRGRSNEVRKPVHPVRGQLVVGGKPAAGAFVFFVPANEAPNPTDPRPRALVGEDGYFDVCMYGDKDGAPAGEYIVTVMWEGEGGYDQLKGQYSEANKSKLRAVVKEGQNELPPFKLN